MSMTPEQAEALLSEVQASRAALDILVQWCPYLFGVACLIVGACIGLALLWAFSDLIKG